MLYECVINISEGRDSDALARIVDAASCVIDLHSDTDHNRSVVTIASTRLDDVFSSAQSVVSQTFSLLSFENHDGVHPCLGVVDVVPFVSYDALRVTPTEETIAAARVFGEWIDSLGTPVFFYDAASFDGTTLPAIRKHAFDDIRPSKNIHELNTSTGATCVGAREPLIAININVDSPEREWVTGVAREIRESSGGMKGVRAIGLALESRNAVQVSMNIVDALHANAGDVCLKVKQLASKMNYECSVELVGLVPEFQYNMWSEEFLEWSGLNELCTVEHFLP